MRLLQSVAAAALAATAAADATTSQRCFPPDFLFGSATASYQVEGGWNETGRTPSIWDDYCRATPGVECANVADDFLHRYKQDIDLMAATGLQTFRFSISWSRVMTWDAATQRMRPNAPGIAFYHDLIDSLLAKQLVPVLTLYHWDLPSKLHTELSPQGWLNPAIVDHFVEYASLMFAEFGAKVPYWTTFNEPTSFVISGYGTATHAPALPQSETNTYTVAHHVLLAHAAAVAKFRALRSAEEAATRTVAAGAKIGIVLVTDYSYPLDPTSAADVATAARKMEFMFGWFLKPIVDGEYPAVMRERVGDRLPQFTPAQAAQLKGSYDLFMLNHYHSKAVTDCASPSSSIACDQLSLGWERDHGVDDTRRPDGARPSSTGPQGEYLCPWFSAYPQGYADTIRYMHRHDTSAQILLTENGWCGNATVDNADQSWYFEKFLEQVHIAVAEEQIPVIGYTAWSLLDNYEWGSFKPRFGLYYVNFTEQTGAKEGWTPGPNDLARIPRPAASWFHNLATTKCMSVSSDPNGVAPLVSLAQAQAQAQAGTTATTVSHSTTAVAAIVVAVVAAVAVVAVLARRRRQSQGTAAETTPLIRA